MEDQGPQRPTAEQRRRIEEEEARREALYAAEVARQRALLQETEDDAYVTRRVQREMEAAAEAQRLGEQEELAKSGGVPDSNPYPLLVMGVLIGLAVVAMILLLARG